MPRLTEQCKELLASAMRDGIYEAAVEVLGRHGLDGLTMDRVAEAAGIAKGSLYNYFRGKEELVALVFEKTVEPARQAVTEILAQPIPALRKLEAILRVWFEFFAKQRGIFDFLLHDRTSRELLDSPEHSMRADAIEKFERVFRQGMEEGAFREVDVTRAAEMLLGAVTITIEQQVALGEQRPVDESVGSLLEVFWHGLKRPS
jgi:AcrR family transcriptional regulator